MNNTIIEIDHASYHYDAERNYGVEQLSLDIRAGECVLLLGQSGCGKTTLTRLINGLIPHFYDGELSGDVVIDGQLTAATPLDKLALHIGSVFQNPRSQFFNLDTTSEIAFGCENLGFPPEEIRRRVDSAAAELGISHLLDRDIFALSGGEKQLVALASSYALEPRILVLDEPSSNLDAQACTQLAAQLARLKASGKTIVIAEHRIHYLEDIYDRVLLIVDGRVADEWGSAEFSALSVAELEALGLRTRSLDGLVPRRPAAAASSAAPTLQPPAPAAAQPHPTPHPQPHPQPQSHPPTQSPRLQVYGLTAGYKHQAPIINKLSFHAAPGEIIAIIGANGQGKSTLARVLCGLHREWQGTVELDGKPLRPTQRPGLFYLVMQESSYQLFTDSVQNEMLLSSSRRHRPSAEKVQQILELLSLEDYRQRHPMSLSGGQKQRCAIGAAMAHDAEVLIFDEPTSGLDFANMCRVVEVLNQLSRQGKLLFIITHDYELLLRACTRALVLDGGRITRDLPIDASAVGLDGALGFSAASHTTHPSVDASTLPEIKAVLRKR